MFHENGSFLSGIFPAYPEGVSAFIVEMFTGLQRRCSCSVWFSDEMKEVSRGAAGVVKSGVCFEPWKPWRAKRGTLLA
jgi:hypothetical protein